MWVYMYERVYLFFYGFCVRAVWVWATGCAFVCACVPVCQRVKRDCGRVIHVYLAQDSFSGSATFMEIVTSTVNSGRNRININVMSNYVRSMGRKLQVLTRVEPRSMAE
jgi:hypothetical protein